MPDARAGSDDAGTLLSADEQDALIPTHVSTKVELNQWEALNIAHAHEWLSRRRPSAVLSAEFLRELHVRMFGDTWTWAGTFRRTDNNISLHAWANVPMLVRDLVDNTQTRYDACDKTPTSVDEVATRFHHEVVRIHPWPNGNGRHARLATDLLLEQWGRPPFAWGSGADLAAIGKQRAAYIEALRCADAGDVIPLVEFVRS